MVLGGFFISTAGFVEFAWVW